MAKTRYRKKMRRLRTRRKYKRGGAPTEAQIRSRTYKRRQYKSRPSPLKLHESPVSIQDLKKYIVDDTETYHEYLIEIPPQESGDKTIYYIIKGDETGEIFEYDTEYKMLDSTPYMYNDKGEWVSKEKAPELKFFYKFYIRKTK